MNKKEFKNLQEKYDFIIDEINNNKTTKEVADMLGISSGRVIEVYNRETRRRKYRDKLFADLFDNDAQILNALYRNKLDLTNLKLIYDDDHDMKKLKDRKGIGIKTIQKIREVLSSYFGMDYISIKKTISIDIDILYVTELLRRTSIALKVNDLKLMMVFEDISSIDSLIYIRHTDCFKEFNIDEHIEFKCIFPTIQDFIKYIYPNIINILEKKTPNKK